MHYLFVVATCFTATASFIHIVLHFKHSINAQKYHALAYQRTLHERNATHYYYISAIEMYSSVVLLVFALLFVA